MAVKEKTTTDIIRSSLFTVCSEPRRMQDVQYRKCTHAIFVVNINASLYTVIKKLEILCSEIPAQGAD